LQKQASNGLFRPVFRFARIKETTRVRPGLLNRAFLRARAELIFEYGYLLDTTTPYMLWGDECRIRCWSHLDGLLCQPEKQLAS